MLVNVFFYDLSGAQGCSALAPRYTLAMEPRWKSALEMLVRDLTAIPDVERVVLFGSRARGDNRERSDIDLAVVAPGASSITWDRVKALAEDAPTLLSIDVVRLDQAGAALRKVVEDEGIVLFERPRAA